MPQVSDSYRREQLREARRHVDDAVSKLNRAQDCLEAIITTHEDREAADAIEIAIRDLDLLEIPDPDEDTEDEEDLEEWSGYREREPTGDEEE